MKPSRVREVLLSLLETRWAAFIWGAPGVGKSSVIADVAHELKVPLRDIRASLLDPTDLRGIPVVDGQTARWCPPSFLPSKGEKPGILFFDELTAAAPLVQASLYQLTLDRRVGEYELPDGWRILAAGNRAEDLSIAFRMPSALANRFVHLEFEIDFDDWRAWAIKNDIHPLVLGFLSTRQELLFDMSNAERGFPTPRSWEITSDVVKQMGMSQTIQDVLLGIVGEAASIEFIGYWNNVLSEEAIRKILKDPDNAALPDDLASQYALISYTTAMAGDSDIREAAGRLLARFQVELAVLLLRNILQMYPGFMTQPAVMAFMASHKDLIL